MESLDNIPIVGGIIRWLRRDRPATYAPDRPSELALPSHRRFSRRPPASDGLGPVHANTPNYVVSIPIVQKNASTPSI